MNFEYAHFWRGLFAVAAFLFCGTLEALSQIRSKTELDSQLAKQPLTFFIARAGDNSCGAGCNTWVGVEGQFDKGSAARFAAFVERHQTQNLPVFLSSSGGLTDEGIEFGRFLRSKAMRAGIASSKADCTRPRASACRVDMAAGRPVSATWVSRNAICSSACVFALLGATTRLVPVDSKVGVHSTAYFCFRENGRVMQPVGKSKDAVECRSKLDAQASDIDRYIAEMGVSGELLQVMNSVPSSHIRFLTRDEIKRYRIASD